MPAPAATQGRDPARVVRHGHRSASALAASYEHERRSMQREMPPTFGALLDEACRHFGGRTLLPRRSHRDHRPVTFAELRTTVRELAAGILTLGLERGDRMALIGENRCEWLAADLACGYVGVVDVPRGSDTTGGELRHILAHAGCRAAFAENDAVADELQRHRAALPHLGAVVVLQEHTAVPGVVALPDLCAEGARYLAAQPDGLTRRAMEVDADDLLTIVYTSGTTAQPKGVMLTHCNVLSNVRMVKAVLEIDAADVFLSVLPAWHMYERIMDYVALCSGASLVFTDRKRIKDDLKSVQPTVFAAVPRIWESIHDGIVTHVMKQKGARRALLDSVVRTCRKVGSGRAPLAHRLLHRVFDRIALPAFRRSTGGRLRIAVSGGGSLPAHVDECLLGIGLPLLNGYGLTETSPVVSVRRPHDNRAGTIGRPLPETEVEVRDEHGRPLPCGETGVLWVRGPQVMRGYYRNPDATAQVLADDGWFNTGDLCCLQPDGHIRITGRAKDTIVLAGGENVEPERLETMLKTSPYVDQAVVVGQDQKVLGALLVAAPELLEQVVPREKWVENDGVLRGPEVAKLYRAEIDRLLSREQGFRPCERIAAFRIVLQPLSVENQMLTATLKVRRHVVQARLGHLIAEMFEASRPRGS